MFDQIKKLMGDFEQQQASPQPDLRIKVCGMRQPDNIAAVAQLNPDYMGFIFFKDSKRYIGEMAQSAFATVPERIRTVGVFVDEPLAAVADAIEEYKLDAVQLHGAESPSYCTMLKTVGNTVMKAFGITNSFDFNQLNAYVGTVDYFLFDTKTSTHGGSGKTFNWQLLDNYKLDVPFFLSGGIGIQQLEELKALRHPQLYGVDLNSCFETEPAIKDIELLKTFFDTL